ncbi:hypothetical protein [Niabella hirudinis]|uniref:hypothetical protein n=1 Tax=Niabella hirudinis TaxID=1285929 RepID=UPI003EB9D44E
MTTMAPWHVNELRAALYRLLVQGTVSQPLPADHSDGRGYFETASALDPFGSVFRMMTGKEETTTRTKKGGIAAE